MAVVRRPLNGGAQAGYRRPRAGLRGPRIDLPLRPLALVVVGLLVLVAVGLLVQAGMVWGQRQLDTMRYGFPRTAQISAYVGHGDERLGPTVIETRNINGQISVLVFPAGNANQVNVLDGPYLVGPDAPYEVARPMVQDMNGDTHVDLLVEVRGELVVYINERGTFRLMTVEERADLQEQRIDLLR